VVKDNNGEKKKGGKEYIRIKISPNEKG